MQRAVLFERRASLARAETKAIECVFLTTAKQIGERIFGSFLGASKKELARSARRLVNTQNLRRAKPEKALCLNHYISPSSENSTSSEAGSRPSGRVTFFSTKKVTKEGAFQFAQFLCNHLIIAPVAARAKLAALKQHRALRSQR